MKKLLISTVAALCLVECGFLLAQKSKQTYPTDPRAIAECIMQNPQRDEGVSLDMVRTDVEREEKMSDADKAKDEVVARQFFAAYNNARATEMMGLYDRATANRLVSQHVAYAELRGYYNQVERVKSAVQANEASGETSLHLQAYQIAQNARIIELLEKRNAKSK